MLVIEEESDHRVFGCSGDTRRQSDDQTAPQFASHVSKTGHCLGGVHRSHCDICLLFISCTQRLRLCLK